MAAKAVMTAKPSPSPYLSVYYDDTIAIPLCFCSVTVLSCFLDLPHTPLCVFINVWRLRSFLFVSSNFHAFMSNGMVWAVRSGAVICFFKSYLYFFCFTVTG